LIKENQRTLNQINGLTDVLILFPCMILAYFIRFTLFHGMPGHIVLSYYLMTVLCVSPLFWLLYGLMGLYDSFRAKNFLQEFSLLLRSNTIIFGILLAFFFAFKQFHLSRWTLFVFFALATIAVAVKRWFLRRLLRSFREHGYNLKHVLLIGCGEQGEGRHRTGAGFLRGQLSCAARLPAGHCLSRYIRCAGTCARACRTG